MTWASNPFKIPQLFSKQGNSCEPAVSSQCYEVMRLEYQNHGRVDCLTVDRFGYPHSLHRQFHYIVLQSQHTPHSQHSDSLIILPRLTPLWRLLFTKYTFLQLPLLLPEFSIQTEQISVSCCLLVTAQLVGRISNIFPFIIILLRPLHLDCDPSLDTALI